MATEKPDIFVGSYVRVALNRDTTSEIPSYFDPGYIETKNLAGFPEVSLSPEVQTVEEYRDEYVVKLSGDIVAKDTQLSIFNVPDDPLVVELNSAIEGNYPLRFRNLYVIDSEHGENSQNGLYHIFDAYVKKVTTSGSSDSVVTNHYTLSPTGRIFQGFVNVGEIIREGDYGVGAGTEDIPGVKDLGLLTGNRWITVDASHSQNPFGSDTSAMAIQHPNNLGWEIIGQTVGAPAIRIRNKKLESDGSVEASKWVKVYSETDKPQAADNDFVSKANGGTGSQGFQKEVEFKAGVKISATFSGGSNLNGLYSGNGDGDTREKTNMDLRSWYGIGIWNSCTTDGVQGRTIWFSARRGTIGTVGDIVSGSQVIANASTPTAAQHLTRKDYVDNGLNKKINVGSTIDFGTF
ncbi:tail fiber protein [Klebsiella pneumoniae]|uniref:tail fiber protein n=1 Tax=Klebsiella pneumoniae TaxID=573 RepID=UPI001C93475E|nr:tail fiber protein [Klebsiella pneumoniae]MBW6028425.1 hypothetical protein [Klebsiella pneumoniae]